jgi:hypothetical protein
MRSVTIFSWSTNQQQYLAYSLHTFTNIDTSTEA